MGVMGDIKLAVAGARFGGGYTDSWDVFLDMSLPHQVRLAVMGEGLASFRDGDKVERSAECQDVIDQLGWKGKEEALGARLGCVVQY